MNVPCNDLFLHNIIFSLVNVVLPTIAADGSDIKKGNA